MKQKILNLIRINNPISKKFFEEVRSSTASETMTVNGTIYKIGFLLLIMLSTAFFNWYLFDNSYSNLSSILMFFGTICGLVLAIITYFKPTLASQTAVFYSACQGLALGAISAFSEKAYPGIVPIVICLTSCTVIAILFAYLIGFLKATENFKLMIFAGTASITLTYTISIILTIFGINMPVIHDASICGIIFSIFAVCIAAFNLVLDFDLIENAAENRAAKYMEWFAAFNILITLIWLYVEIFKLITKTRRRGSK